MPQISEKIRRRRVTLLLCLLALLPACASAPAPIAPLPIAADDYRRTFEAAVASLRDHGFVVDRQDYRFGRITTQPRLAPAIVEVWNPDNSTCEQALASTLNDQHRIATIELNRADPAADGAATAESAAPYQLTAQVEIQRASDPNRRLTGSTSGFAVTRSLSATPEQYRREGITGRSYHTVERDPYFEQRLLADIQARLAGHEENGE